MKKRILIYLGFCTAACGAGIDCGAAPAGAASVPFELHGEGGRLRGTLRGIPLGRVADALQAKAHVEMRFNDPALAAEPVSATLAGEDLETAVRAILRGYSYILRGSARSPSVVVLSNSSGSAAGEDAGLPGSGDFPEGVPRNLDKFRAIQIEADAGESGNGGDDAQTREAQLQRALDVLKSPHVHLFADAIDQLGTLADPRGVDALIHLAKRGPARLMATEALTRVASQVESGDMRISAALQQLGADADEAVRSAARQALEQISQTQVSFAEN